MKMTCIAVDDEPLALDQMIDFINKRPNLELEATFKKGFDALIYIKQNPVDLVFLDVHLEDISGIQILRTLKRKPYVILTTAYDQYALEGYELDVNDYLLKPISFARFVKAVEKIQDMRTDKSKWPDQNTEPLPKIEYIFVKADYKMRKIFLKDILFIEGYKDYMKFVLFQKPPVVSLMSFKKIENMLPAQDFIRIHKSFVVSVEKIDSVSRNAIKIAEYNLPIGETFKTHFFQFLQGKGFQQD